MNEHDQRLNRLIQTNSHAPERIYGWMDSQLSIARHYGAIDVYGHRYVIALDEPRQPLVRDDVLKREGAEKREAEKRAREADKQARKAAEARQGDLL